MNKIIDYLPKMKTGKELILALEVLPSYDKQICNEDTVARLIALSDLYKIYIPSFMSVEIYSKLYLALIRSINKKQTKLATVQQNENFKAVSGYEYRGIMGGSDSFTIIGASGIGKSSAISRAITLITEDKIIQTTEPYSKIIPCVIVQCPFDSSVKGLLLEILRKVDESIDSSYYEKALRSRATTDMLIGSVSQVALNHIGLLIVDEIQNVVNSKNGKSLVGSLTQLINNSGISICMVGTPESSIFFEQAMQLARRSLGLNYGEMKYDEHFRQFCEQLFSYRYVKQEMILTDSIIQWLYEHSNGITSVVVSLIHDAQEIAILNNTETLSIENLEEAYQKRLSLLHSYIKPQMPSKTVSKKSERINIKRIENAKNEHINANLLQEILSKSKSEQIDILTLMRDKIQVEEVRI